jgi:hypothetical protein
MGTPAGGGGQKQLDFLVTVGKELKPHGHRNLTYLSRGLKER